MYRKNKKEEFYTKKAKEEGYPARSVYKLLQIDEEFGIIRKGDSVLDLGSAPGSWLLYVSKKIGKKGRVFGIDKKALKTKILWMS
jgi:23S rRNA (uridine2552-2'-O)-methyltransferase